MVIVFYYLCDGINMAVRTWFILNLLEEIFEPKWNKKKINIGNILIIILGSYTQVSQSYMYKILFSNGMLTAMIFNITIASLLFYKCNFRDVIWINILGWIALSLIDFFLQICAYLILDKLGKKVDLFLSVNIWRAYYLIIYTIVVIFIGFKLRKWLKEKSQKILKYQKQGLILCLLLTPCLIYFQRIYLKMGSILLFNQWWIFLLTFMLIVLVFWLNLIKQKSEEEIKIQQLENKMLEENYQALLQSYNDKSILIHDIKNHMRTIQKMIEENQQKESLEYILQITGEIQQGEHIVWTNHKILDLILNMKFQRAKETQIKVQCRADDMSNLILNSAEICALFANLLDNAIEASEKCEIKEERSINVICKKHGKMLVISIFNLIPKEMNHQSKLPLKTTKKEKDTHGFGILSMKKVIYDHDGYMKVNVYKDQFQVVIYLNGF